MYRGRGRGGGRYFRGGRGYGDPSSEVVGRVGDGCELSSYFRSVDGGNYGMLKELTGRSFVLPVSSGVGADRPCQPSLMFHHIQPDPFAPGSQVSVKVAAPFCLQRVVCGEEGGAHGLDVLAVRALRKVAAEDFLWRSFVSALMCLPSQSGALQRASVSQHVLQRSAISIDMSASTVNLCFRVKLPGHGRRIDGCGAVQVLLGEMWVAVCEGVLGAKEDVALAHVISVLDQEWLRQQLQPRKWAAFLCNGAILPRDAGDSDEPLKSGAVAFTTPDSLAQCVRLPFSQRDICGMAIPQGLTLIAGGGFHGKSTMLRALELGIYNHVPGDGRELVVVDPTAVKIRAEDRRSVSGVNISGFITNLPFRHNTTAFSTPDASGSTSQAANIMEALELGATTLLLDEDTCATNLMYRDALMEQLVAREEEPITPFVERVGELGQRHGVSSIMVIGGSGQYFHKADVVLVMHNYHVTDRTQQAKVIASAWAAQSSMLRSPTPDVSGEKSVFQLPPQRRLAYADTFRFVRPQHGRSATKVSGSGLRCIRLSEEHIDLTMVEQLVEEGQVEAIAQCLAFIYDGGVSAAEKLQTAPISPRPGMPSLPLVPEHLWGSTVPSGFCQLIRNCEAHLRRSNLEIQTPSCYMPRGFAALPRVFEIGAALNRLRPLFTVK